MPYDPDFFRSLLAIAHGWKPKKKSLAKIGQAKAKAMVAEGKKSDDLARGRGRSPSTA